MPSGDTLVVTKLDRGSRGRSRTPAASSASYLVGIVHGSTNPALKNTDVIALAVKRNHVSLGGALFAANSDDRHPPRSTWTDKR